MSQPYLLLLSTTTYVFLNNNVNDIPTAPYTYFYGTQGDILKSHLQSRGT